MFATDQGAKIINMSLSGRKSSQMLADAVNYATERGVLIVAAAGNSGGPVEYPAYYENVLAVGAVDFEQDRAPYSNFGPQVDVVAPGGNTGVDRNGDGYPDGILQQTFQGGNYGSFDFFYLEGTSMAAPHCQRPGRPALGAQSQCHSRPIETSDGIHRQRPGGAGPG